MYVTLLLREKNVFKFVERLQRLETEIKNINSQKPNSFSKQNSKYVMFFLFTDITATLCSQIISKDLVKTFYIAVFA